MGAGWLSVLHSSCPIQTFQHQPVPDHAKVDPLERQIHPPTPSPPLRKKFLQVQKGLYLDMQDWVHLLLNVNDGVR